MSSESMLINLNNVQNLYLNPLDSNNGEATRSSEEGTGDQISPNNDEEIIKDTPEKNKTNEITTDKIEEQNSNSQVEIDIDHVKAKVSLVEKKSVKEVLLIEIYGADKPETGYSITAVPSDRPSVHLTRQSRRYRTKAQAFFMASDRGADGGGIDYENGDPETRNIFVRKVFSIVLLMLLVTALFVALAYNSESMRETFKGRSMRYAVLGAAIVLLFVSCIIPSDCARVPPCNYICLLLAVLCMSFMCAAISCRYTAISVIVALLITAAIVMMCLALAFTSFDFTKFLIYVLAGMAVLALCSLVYLILKLCGVYVPAMHMILLVISTLLQTFMLIIELQMILGGKSIELSEEDYALGAFMVYTSIMQLFMNILQLIGQVE